MQSSSFETPHAVPAEAWFAACRDFVREEKEFTRQRDRLAARRRALPWLRLDASYRFTSAGGTRSLAELFGGRSQLIVYHFMLGAGWEEGCVGCSLVSDHFDATLAHLAARDVSFTAVSSAPLKEIQRFKQRMGWTFDWVSSHGTPFNEEMGVAFTPEQIAGGRAHYNFREMEVPMAEMPGLSVFARDAGGAVYRTYSTYSRGLDLLIGTYNLLDLVPKGRDENPEEPMSWVRHHDRYEPASLA